jgi:hypothetical protein
VGGGKQRDGKLHDGLDQQNCGHDKALQTAKDRSAYRETRSL